jgi:hypothetical protein
MVIQRALITLAVLGTLGVTNLALAAGPEDGLNVKVVNMPANPIPVTGTVNVGNLGATTLPVSVTNFPATQPVSGTVSVGNLPAVQQVSGTVSVGNLPAVQQVSVTNASSAPVLVRVLNAPGSSPFVAVLNPQTPAFVVPSTVNGLSAQALVVTQVSGACTGIGSFALALQDAVGSSVIANYYFPVGGLQGGLFPMLAQQTQIYFSAGHSVVLSDAVAGNGCSFDLSGYFVTQ